jgi:hypothetical protein
VAGGGPEAVASVALGDDVAREGGAGIEPRNPTPAGALRTEAATVAAIREALATSPPGLCRVKQGIKASYYKTDRSNSGACKGGYRTGLGGFPKIGISGSLVSGKTSSRQLSESRQSATTSTRRFPANQIPALCFRALLNEEAPEVELALV